MCLEVCVIYSYSSVCIIQSLKRTIDSGCSRHRWLCACYCGIQATFTSNKKMLLQNITFILQNTKWDFSSESGVCFHILKLGQPGRSLILIYLSPDMTSVMSLSFPLRKTGSSYIKLCPSYLLRKKRPCLFQELICWFPSLLLTEAVSVDMTARQLI